MRSLFSRLFARRPAARPIKRTILGLESLEGRVVPSATSIQLSPEQAYEIAIHSTHTSKVEKQIAKKNTLTLKNLSPGNYASHSSVAVQGHEIVAHHTTSHPLIHLT